MDRIAILNKIIDGGIVVILRLKNKEQVISVAKAVSEGGIHTIEVTMNTPNALQCIEELSKTEGILPGIGTVTNPQMVRDAVAAGAEFVVSPVSKKEVIETCRELDKPIISGAFSPGEIFQAFEWGADVVKVFPADAYGMKYFKALRGPFPQIKLMPAGGVNPENIDKWFDSGATFVGVGGSFTNTDIINNEEWGRITHIAKDFTTNIRHYKTCKK